MPSSFLDELPIAIEACLLKASASASVVSSCQILSWKASSIACAYLVVVGLIVTWLDVVGLEDGPSSLRSL